MRTNKDDVDGSDSDFMWKVNLYEIYLIYQIMHSIVFIILWSVQVFQQYSYTIFILQFLQLFFNSL